MPFFRRLFPIPSDIVAIHRDFVQVIENFERAAVKGDLTATRQARLCISAYADFMSDLEKIAERTVLLADEVITSKYDSSRVGRPHTPGPQHLRDALPTSQKIDTGLPTGSVGIVDLDSLEKYVYWKAQEFGSDHNVGREVMGLFSVPGTAFPDPNQFRTHALFTPTGRGRIAHIQNPIPEGRFIRDGLDIVERYWSGQMVAAGQDAMTDLSAAAGMGRGRGLSRVRREGNFQRNFPRLKTFRGNPSAIRSAIERL